MLLSTPSARASIPMAHIAFQHMTTSCKRGAAVWRVTFTTKTRLSTTTPCHVGARRLSTASITTTTTTATTTTTIKNNNNNNNGAHKTLPPIMAPLLDAHPNKAMVKKLAFLREPDAEVSLYHSTASLSTSTPHGGTTTTIATSSSSGGGATTPSQTDLEDLRLSSSLSAMAQNVLKHASLSSLPTSSPGSGGATGNTNNNSPFLSSHPTTGSSASLLASSHDSTQPPDSSSSSASLNLLDNPVMTQVIQLIMKDGLKARAYRAVVEALRTLHAAPPPPGTNTSTFSSSSPVARFVQAIDTVAPLVKVASVRRGRKAVPTPMPLSQKQGRRQAIVWLRDAASKAGKVVHPRHPSSDNEGSSSSSNRPTMGGRTSAKGAITSRSSSSATSYSSTSTSTTTLASSFRRPTFGERLGEEVLRVLAGKSEALAKRTQMHKNALVNRSQLVLQDRKIVRRF